MILWISPRSGSLERGFLFERLHEKPKKPEKPGKPVKLSAGGGSPPDGRAGALGGKNEKINFLDFID
ncbi:hypothetical protein COU12_01275 [Candidatus Jorgensenbacteria bacterium CG10_big_fil_rev_8_21_14_0_10_54_38]|uniref:Uncharacterized protein n=2 Tax=Candidatus Joergenseniibacteriota TaxID=1752739 RepID=A0A2M6WG48_9BACT|nr:MAG: hypothetical protein COX26_01145 [Candidatus Jorgensenbacteria bacterium CG23_combo_of_CG06-09_8_20_14_all_54_14]PIT91783.1 MAG: hypothetical protein COU12_01275 [Candidatus Jorgensenbacteria bacterium CG10_big_fil_rev_8_21_14_0_10_54_38]